MGKPFEPDWGILLAPDKKEVSFKTFNGTPVDALYFYGQNDLKRADELLRSAGISTYESDIDPARRYLMEKNIL